MCYGSFLCMLRVMDGVFCPASLVIASRSVFVICRWFRSAKAFSQATRHTLSFGLEMLGGLFLKGWYGIEAIFWAYDACRLRPRYGLCSQLGSRSMWLVGEVCPCACALFMACSRACLSLLGVLSGSARDVPGHAVGV